MTLFPSCTRKKKTVHAAAANNYNDDNEEHNYYGYHRWKKQCVMVLHIIFCFIYLRFPTAPLPIRISRIF